MTQQEKWDKLAGVKTFVLDMDGTIYLGEQLFPYTRDFLRAVTETGRSFCFFINNSSKMKKRICKNCTAWASTFPKKKCD